MTYFDRYDVAALLDGEVYMRHGLRLDTNGTVRRSDASRDVYVSVASFPKKDDLLFPMLPVVDLFE